MLPVDYDEVPRSVETEEAAIVLFLLNLVIRLIYSALLLFEILPFPTKTEARRPPQLP
jgi:hypothetical protein